MKPSRALASGLFAAQLLLLPVAFAADVAPVTPSTAPAATPAAATAPSPAVVPSKGLHFPPGPPNGEPLARQPSGGRQNDPTFKITPLARYNHLGYGSPASLKVNVHGGLEGDFSQIDFVYLVESGGTGIAVVNELGDTLGSGNIFGKNDRFSLALKNLEALDQVRTGSYEVRYLIVYGPSYPYGPNARTPPAIYELLWLKSDTGGTDLIYPVWQNPMLPEQKLYLASEFFQAFQAQYATLSDVRTTPAASAALTPPSVRPTATAPATTPTPADQRPLP